MVARASSLRMGLAGNGVVERWSVPDFIGAGGVLETGVFTEGREGNEGAVGRAMRGGESWGLVLAAGFFDGNGDLARRDLSLGATGDVMRWGKTKRKTGGRGVGLRVCLDLVVFIFPFLKLVFGFQVPYLPNSVSTAKQRGRADQPPKVVPLSMRVFGLGSCFFPPPRGREKIFRAMPAHILSAFGSPTRCAGALRCNVSDTRGQALWLPPRC